MVTTLPKLVISPDCHDCFRTRTQAFPGRSQRFSGPVAVGFQTGRSRGWWSIWFHLWSKLSCLFLRLGPSICKMATSGVFMWGTLREFAHLEMLDFRNQRVAFDCATLAHMEDVHFKVLTDCDATTTMEPNTSEYLKPKCKCLFAICIYMRRSV